MMKFHNMNRIDSYFQNNLDYKHILFLWNLNPYWVGKTKEQQEETKQKVDEYIKLILTCYQDLYDTFE